MRAKKECLKIEERNWPCFTCRGLCKCKRCKRALIEELNQLNNEKTLLEYHKYPKGESREKEVENMNRHKKSCEDCI